MYHMIINPASRSGRGGRIWTEIEPILKEQNIAYTAHFSTGTGDVTKIVRTLCDTFLNTSPDSILQLIVLGGDGTMNETLQGITDFDRVRVGYIPTGSSNDMARDLKLPKSPAETLQHIISCKEAVKMDIGCVSYKETPDAALSMRYFAVSCGIGFDAAVCEEALYSKFKRMMNKIGLGKLTYLGIALKQLIMAKRVSCKLVIDDTQTISFSRFLFIAGMIHQYEGGGFMFCPGADTRDGILDICTVGNLPKLLILCALPTAFFGKHYYFKGVERYAARKMQITASAPLCVHTDGEVVTTTDSITLSCLQEKLHFLW